MPTFKDALMIYDPPYYRAVEVAIVAPDDVNFLNAQALAQRAWRAVGEFDLFHFPAPVLGDSDKCGAAGEVQHIGSIPIHPYFRWN